MLSQVLQNQFYNKVRIKLIQLINYLKKALKSKTLN